MLLASKKPILVAVDNSEGALKLAECVGQMFLRGQPVELLHVQPRHAFALVSGLGAAEMAWESQQAQIEKEELESAVFLHDQIAPKLQQAGMSVKTALMRISGDGSCAVGSAICKHAEQIQADMIVLTKLSKSTLQKYFGGSVTKYCVTHACIPVLVV